MNRPPIGSMVMSVSILAFVPALIAFGVYDLPSLSAIRAAHTADTLGVWLLTWGLIVLGIVGALTVSWLAWTADAAARQLERSSADASNSPGHPPGERAALRTQAGDSTSEDLTTRPRRTPSNIRLA